MRIDKINRESLRLRGYSYSWVGEYFVTLSTKDREHLFGEITNWVVQLTLAGGIAIACWKEIPLHFTNIELDEFIVMPNHMRGVIVVVGETRPMIGSILGGAIQESPRLDRNDPDPQSAALGKKRMKSDLCFRKWARSNAGVELTRATVDICKWMVILEVVELVRWSNILPGGRR